MISRRTGCRSPGRIWRGILRSLVEESTTSSDKMLEVGISHNRRGAASFQLLQGLAGDEAFLDRRSSGRSAPTAVIPVEPT